MKTFLLAFLVPLLMLITINPVSLDKSNQLQCQKNGKWTFGISGLVEDNVPEYISVDWEDGSNEMVPLVRTFQQFAFYETRNHLDSLVVNAVASLPNSLVESWNGKFNLLCDKPTGIELTDFRAQNQVAQTSYLKLVGILVFLAIILSILFRGKRR